MGGGDSGKGKQHGDAVRKVRGGKGKKAKEATPADKPSQRTEEGGGVELRCRACGVQADGGWEEEEETWLKRIDALLVLILEV